MWCSGQSYAPFLQKFVPVLLKLLDGPPVFISTSLEQVGSVVVDGLLFTNMKLATATAKLRPRNPPPPADDSDGSTGTVCAADS
jgi:hypothetical protein